jgi:hopanoid biosynthesis associated protein HpnK
MVQLAGSEALNFLKSWFICLIRFILLKMCHCGRRPHRICRPQSPGLREVLLKALTVTADDYGLSLPVNEAVEEGHRRGILTAASLMVAAPAWEDAVKRARRMPSLGVGLHLTLVDGRPVLSPDRVPGLVGPDRRFSNDAARFGIELFFSPELRRQAADEIEAQFARFRETGLRLDHVNGHQHFHMHPVVVDAIARLAPAHGLPPVRIPVEPFRPSYAAIGDRPLKRLSSWLFYFALTRSMRRKLAAAGLPLNDQVFGVNDSGTMIEGRLLRYLDHLPDGVTEVYCHPATRRWHGIDNLPADYQAIEEFAALTSPVVRAKMEGLRLRPVPFRSAVRAAPLS